MYVKDSSGLRKLLRFRDAATGWHRRNKQRNCILIWVAIPGLKLILLAARQPVSSIAFLRLLLRHHFAGKRAGGVKCRLFNRTKILRADWLRYTMETALFSILLLTTEHSWKKRNGNVSWQRRAQIKQKVWPMEKRQIGHWKSCLVLSTRFPVANLRFRPVDKSSYYRQWVNGLSQTRTQ